MQHLGIKREKVFILEPLLHHVYGDRGRLQGDGPPVLLLQEQMAAFGNDSDSSTAQYKYIACVRYANRHITLFF